MPRSRGERLPDDADRRTPPAPGERSLTAIRPQSMAEAVSCVLNIQAHLLQSTGSKKTKQDLRGLNSRKADHERRILLYRGHAPATCIVLPFPIESYLPYRSSICTSLPIPEGQEENQQKVCVHAARVSSQWRAGEEESGFRGERG